jgi:hypothetical protein
MKVKILGSSELKATLKRLPKQFLDASAVGQFNGAQIVMQDAIPRTPLEDGDLRASAYVEDPRYSVHSAIVDMGYAGLPYIARQHEDLSYQHPFGENKFLEKAINAKSGEANQAIADAVSYFLETGKMPKMAQAKVGPRK